MAEHDEAEVNDKPEEADADSGLVEPDTSDEQEETGENNE